MKKITIMMFALAAFTFSANAQDATTAELVLSQTSGAVGDGGVACGDSGAGTTGDNLYIRNYVLDDYGVFEPVSITGVEFFVSTASGETELQVAIYDYVGFPLGFEASALPTPLASVNMTIDDSMVGTLVRAEFDTPAVGFPGSHIQAVVHEFDGQSAQFYLGTAEEETAASYLASLACGIDEPVTVSNVGFPDAKHVINLVTDDELSVGQNLSEIVSVHPNPTTDILNIAIPSSVEVTNVSMFDVLGKNTGVSYSNGVINTSSLSKGVYILNIETTSGNLTQKIVKQ